MIGKFSILIADFVSRFYSMSKKEKAYFNYGLQIILGLFIEAAIMFILAYFLQIFWPVVISALSFLITRPYAGGIHLPSYFLCILSTVAVFLGVGYVSTLIEITPTLMLIIIVIINIYGLYMFNKYAPADTKTVPINDPELRNNYKYKAKYVLLIWTVLSLISIFIFGNYLNLILASALGIFTQIISIHPALFYIVENYLPEHK